MSTIAATLADPSVEYWPSNNPNPHAYCCACTDTAWWCTNAQADSYPDPKYERP
jgi:hypothetical protein